MLQFGAPYSAADVGYVATVRADPSNKPVALQGSAFLDVAVRKAVARWSAAPITPYAGPSTVTPGYPTVKQLSISGDYEDVLSFGIGLDRVAGFQIARLADPDRLVIDVAEPPTWRMWPDDSPTMASGAQAGYDQGHQSWRGSGAAVAWSYAFAVYGWTKPVVTPLGGASYRLTPNGSTEGVSVHTVAMYPTRAHSIWEITNTH